MDQYQIADNYLEIMETIPPPERKRRYELHHILEKILGSCNVYFQPPSKEKLKYPCIIYTRNSGDSEFADNRVYAFKRRYQLTVISKDPDEEISDKLAWGLPMCISDRSYKLDNLHHDVFDVYF